MCTHMIPHCPWQGAQAVIAQAQPHASDTLRPVVATKPPDQLSESVLLSSTARIKELAQEGVLQRVLNGVYNWSRGSSIWPLLFGTACCFIEMAAAAASRYDLSRFGMEV